MFEKNVKGKYATIYFANENILKMFLQYKIYYNKFQIRITFISFHEID